MGSGSKKKAINMGNPPAIRIRLDTLSDGVLKITYVYHAKAKNKTEWYVDIINNGKTHTSPESFGKTEIWLKIFEYCKYYYDKHRK